MDDNSQNSRRQIGWRMVARLKDLPASYRLVPMFEPPDGAIMTSAVIRCVFCYALISGQGGPMNAVCMNCCD